MGSGKRLVISATGFPATNVTWRFIQDAWREPLQALAFLAGEKTIVTGVSPTITPVGDNQHYTTGFVSVNGEILPFIGGESQADVTIVEEVVNLDYDVDTDNDGEQDSLPGYIARYMVFGSGGIETFPFSDLKRLKTIKELSEFTLPANLVQDANYTHTDNNFTTVLLQKLNGIAAGAEVNVQADWNVSNPESDAYIKNKPTNLMTVLRKGNVYLGDIYPGITFNCTFPDVGTTSYMVLGCFELVSGGDINVFFAVGAKASDYFTIHVAETAGTIQSLRFRYLITPMYSN